MPGAVSFARYVNTHQGTMFYVSNRKQSEYAATVANMQKLGFTGMSEKTVLLSTDTSISRRASTPSNGPAMTSWCTRATT